MQIPRWQNVLFLKNSLKISTLLSSTTPATTAAAAATSIHFVASFHSTPTSCEKWKNKWNAVSFFNVSLLFTFENIRWLFLALLLVPIWGNSEFCVQLIWVWTFRLCIWRWKFKCWMWWDVSSIEIHFWCIMLWMARVLFVGSLSSLILGDNVKKDIHLISRSYHGFRKHNLCCFTWNYIK